MTQNKLADLNNHLFAQLERLSDEDVKGEDLREEIGRSKAITQISQQIISNASIILEGEKFIEEYGVERKLKMLE